MVHEPEKPDITLSDWERFREEFPRSLIDDVIDRNEARLPDWFVPSAWGVAVASKELLREAGPKRGIYRPRGWRETSREFYRHEIGSQILIVRRCDNEHLWTIERWNATRRYEVDEVLGWNFGPTPLFARAPSVAMRLAMHWHANEPPRGLTWIKAPQSGLKELAEFARQRRLDEGFALATRVAGHQ